MTGWRSSFQDDVYDMTIISHSLVADYNTKQASVELAPYRLPRRRITSYSLLYEFNFCQFECCCENDVNKFS